MSARTRQSRRRRVLVLALAGVLVGTIGSFALANQVIVSLSISAPAGAGGTNGKPADFTSVSYSFTRPNGGANLQAGVEVGQITVATGYASSLVLDTAWLNPTQAAQVLNNPNASIWIGIYYPVYKGNCTPTHPSLGDTLATMSYSSVDYCVKLDESATGNLVSGGKLALSRTLVSGSLYAHLDDSGVSGTGSCDSLSSGSAFCHLGGSNQNVVFVGASIVTPGGKPQGQQNNVSDLNFYFAVRNQL